MPVSALAYNVVNLPESMTFSDALGVFEAEDISRITIADISLGDYTELTDSEISEFFNIAENLTVTRTINPTPFRGLAVNIYTESGVKTYCLNSGIQIGLYGSSNYICYKLDDKDTEKLLYLDSTYKDDDEREHGEELHRDSARDFLKLPQAPWAQSFAKEAAAKSLLPYEFTNKYADNISREEFCVLLANLICVRENYSSIDKYVSDKGITYLRNYFEDCADADNAINILYALGIVNGRDETHFDPYGTITREEAATLLCRVAEFYIWVGVETELDYEDMGSISDWARFYVTWANEYGIMTGVSDTEFAPQGNYTVEQAIATVVRLFNLIQ